MKLDIAHQRKWILGGVVLIAAATPGFALFGFGDIVFDPTSYASLVQQLTTLETEYNMVKNNLVHFSFKQQWQTTLHTLQNANIANTLGETTGMNVALNTNSPATSATAWKTATLPVSANATSYLEAQTPGNARMSQLAMIETSDGVSPDCLTAIGQYRSSRSENATATGALLSQQFDGSSSSNSEVEQLNLLNASEAQKMSEMQSEGTLHACLAAQMTVANMERRNAAVQDLNTAIFVAQQRAVNDTAAANEGTTWDSYLP